NANLYTTDPQNPVVVSGNFASQGGGAIYAKAHSSTFSGDLAFGNACAQQARIDGNSAPEGSAVYVDQDSVPFGSIGSGLFRFNSGGCGSPPPDAVACAPGVTCNTLIGNRAVDGDNHPTTGAVIFTNEDAQVFMFRFAMRDNTGGYGLRLIDDTHA